MNVNSIKINNVMLDGEVDFDKELSENEVVEGLVSSVTEHESEITGLIDNENIFGAKNLLPLTLDNLKAINNAGSWSGNAYTLYGVTFTINTDSLGNVTNITVNGTSEATTVFRFTPKFSDFMKDNTAYYISGAPTNTNKAYYQLYNISTSSGVANILTADYSITYTSERSMQGLVLRVNSGVTVTSQVIYPMIRLASDTSSTYVPYSKSNNQLTSDATMLSTNKEILGAKNMLPLTLDTLKSLNTSGTWASNVYTLSDVTFTINTDNVGNVTNIIVNGTNESDDNIFFRLTNDFTFAAIISYILNGSTGGSITTYFIFNSTFDNDPYYQGDDEITLETSTSRSGSFYLVIRKDITLSNQVFKPMLRLATDTNKTYRPYAMGNQELTQRLLSLEARVTALEG